MSGGLVFWDGSNVKTCPACFGRGGTDGPQGFVSRVVWRCTRCLGTGLVPKSDEGWGAKADS